MSENLPRAFRWLQSHGSPICQYKVCSTFDSSPEIGSIGRALEIGQDIFGTQCVPVVVGAPHLGRYVAFSHLFAGSKDGIYRIDRHPVTVAEFRRFVKATDRVTWAEQAPVADDYPEAAPELVWPFTATA